MGELIERPSMVEDKPERKITRKRSKEEMAENILRAARTPESTVSQVMQLVSLSWDSWQELIPKMRSAGLLLVKDGFYRTTDKGLEYIELREKLKALMPL